MQTLTTISFVRHGEPYNPLKIVYGRMPGFPLSPKGYWQVEATAGILRTKSVVAIYTSLLCRTVQTAEMIRVSNQCQRPPLYISHLITEVYSFFEGRTIEEVRDRCEGDMYTGVPPPYEQPADVLIRTQQFVARVRREHPGQHVVAVSRGDIIALLPLWAIGKSVAPKQRAQPYPAPASISTFFYETSDANEVPRYEYVEPTMDSGVIDAVQFQMP